MINFYLNGRQHQLTHLNPNTTVLEYLRLHTRQMETKEGCGSGDCGACTVMAQRLSNQGMDSIETMPFYTLNACITLLSLMDNHHILTSAYLADNPEHHPDRAVLHPAQQAMVDHHGSQCGFCTPGFIMSLACVYENKRAQQQISANRSVNDDLSYDDLIYDDLDYDDIVASISGNLCRCTGYRPIIEAGLAMQRIGQQRDNDQIAAKNLTLNLASDAMKNVQSQSTASEDLSESIEADYNAIMPALTEKSRQLFIPQSTDELDQLLAQHPKAIIWAGGTDLGLSVTQNLIDHDTIIQLAAIDELKSWSLMDNDIDVKVDEAASNANQSSQTSTKSIIFGAGMSYADMLPVLEQYYPEFAHLFERIASPQIRNMGTLGGNVANASPIGDLPPVLLALDAQIHIRHCVTDDCAHQDLSSKPNMSGTNPTDEIIPLLEFFLDYKKTKLRAGSYVAAIHVPLMQDNQHLFIHKISKRYEDDISACLLAARIDLSADGTMINEAKIALGGMAAIPLLAKNCQQALIGQPPELSSFVQAAQLLSQDVSPMTDVRASREYRMHVVQRLLIKCGKQLIKTTQTDHV